MATCSEIISRALRMARIVAIGDEASAEEADEGMTVLLSIYQRLADTALATSVERNETGDYMPAPGERVYCTGTITLPTQDADGRRIADLAAIQYNEGGGWQTWISDRGDWVRIDALVETDDAPFADRNREGLSALVAHELASTFGKELGPTDIAKARRFQSQMQPVDDSPVEYY